MLTTILMQHIIHMSNRRPIIAIFLINLLSRSFNREVVISYILDKYMIASQYKYDIKIERYHSIFYIMLFVRTWIVIRPI